MRNIIMIIAGVVGLSAGGMVIAQQTGQINNGYIEEGDLLRPGNIIQTITLSNRGQDANTCRNLCDGKADCGAYTYRQTAPNRKPECLLRLIALPERGTRRNHGFAQAVSGTKISFLTDVHKMTPVGNRNVQGAPALRSFPAHADDPVHCSDICWRDGDCGSYTYSPAGTEAALAMCTLNRTGGTLVSKQGYLSGAKAGALKTPTLRRIPRPIVTREPGIIPKIERARPVIRTIRDGKATGDPEQFPGEMLDPEQFPGEMLDPES